MGALVRHPKGTPVSMANPTTGKLDVGRILAEVWPRAPEDFADTAPVASGWREAAFVAQLIAWLDGSRTVRITYYVRKEGGGPDAWTFGGQDAPIMPIEVYRLMLEQLVDVLW